MHPRLSLKMQSLPVYLVGAEQEIPGQMNTHFTAEEKAGQYLRRDAKPDKDRLVHLVSVKFI